MPSIADLIRTFGVDAVREAAGTGEKAAAEEAFNAPSFKVGDASVSPEDFSQVASSQSVPNPNFSLQGVPRTDIPLNSQSQQMASQMPPQFSGNVPAVRPPSDFYQGESGVPATIDPGKSGGFYQGESGVPSTEFTPGSSGMRDVTENIPQSQDDVSSFSDVLNNVKKGALAGTAASGAALALMPDSQNLSTSDKQSLESVDVMNRLGLGQYNDPEYYNGDNKQLAISPMRPGKKDPSEDLEEDEEENDEPGKKTMPAQKATASLEKPSNSSSLPNSSKLAQLLATDQGQQTYQNMLKNRDLSILGNQLGQAGNIIGASLARVPVNDAASKVFASNVAQAEQMPKDFQQASAMEEQDPNSAVSKNYREFLKNQGLNVGPGVTAQQVKDVLLPAVEKEKLQSERLQNAKDTKALGMAKINAYRQIQQSNKDRADQEKNDFKDRTEGAQVAKEMNGLSASSKSALGQAATAKSQAQRLQQLLSDPNTTTQDLNTASALMNRIESGASTISGTKDQQYNTLKGTLAKGMQYITSNPQAPDVPQIKQHMIDVAQRMSVISDDVQNHQLRIVKAGHHDFFNRRPEVVNDIIGAIQGTDNTAPQAPVSAPTSNAAGFIPMTKDGINYKPIPNSKIEEAKAHGYR